MKFKTIREATGNWVKEFNAIPQDMLLKLVQNDVDCITEITPPSIGDRVYSSVEDEHGEITARNEAGNYEIELDNGETLTDVDEYDFEVERYDYFPMWGTMWMFGDSCDDYWIGECGGLQAMANCGFRIYESEWGYIFGIDGAGYDFYEAHWIPLYIARGLQWHEEQTDKEQTA
jgi:hypothetical protein